MLNVYLLPINYYLMNNALLKKCKEQKPHEITWIQCDMLDNDMLVVRIFPYDIILLILFFESIAAGDHTNKAEFNEENWSVEDQCSAYEKSKLLAEKAAWEFVKKLPGVQT